MYRKEQGRPRLRSNSLDENSLGRKMEKEDFIVKKGVLKKKGLIFFNNRLVILNLKGVLSYFDLKNLKQPRA